MSLNKKIFVPQAAESIDPRDYFNVKLWTGNSSSRSITGVGFQPDLVYVVPRNYVEHKSMFDSVRGTTKSLLTTLTNVEYTGSDSLTSYDSDGFGLGADAAQRVNHSGKTYVGFCFKGGGNSNTYNIDGTGYSTVSAAGITLDDEVGSGDPTMAGCSINTKAGFGIYKIDPNNSVSTDRAAFTHKLTSAPELIITKSTDMTLNWWTFTDAVDDSWDYLKLNGTDAKEDDTLTGAAAADSTEIRLEHAFTSTTNSVIVYAFHSVEGVQKVGTYNGINGTDVTVTTGFRPKFVLIKKVNSTSSWFLYDDERQNFDDFQARILMANSTSSENNWDSFYGLKATSTGFILEGYSGGNDSTNKTGDSYIYLAIA